MKFLRFKSRIYIFAGIFAAALTIHGGEKLYGECGGYVTIGNKAKLKELQAKGYLPSEMKGSHAKPETSNSQSDRENKNTTQRKSHHLDQAVENLVRIPLMPCSGPNCRSGRTPQPAPKEFVPLIGVVKLAFKASPSKHSDDKYSGFVGYQSLDEVPFATKECLDRPPE